MIASAARYAEAVPYPDYLALDAYALERRLAQLALLGARGARRAARVSARRRAGERLVRAGDRMRVAGSRRRSRAPGRTRSALARRAETPSLADRVAAAGRTGERSRSSGRWHAAALAAQQHLIAAAGRRRACGSGRVQLHPGAERLRRAVSTPARSRCSSGRRGRGRLSRAGRVPGVALDARLERPELAPGRGCQARRRAAGLRRPRRDDRAARHRRRPRHAVPARPLQRGSTSSSATPRRSPSPDAGRAASSSATGRSSPACSSARAGPAACRASPGASTLLPIRVAGWQRDATGGWASTHAPTS